MKPFDALPNDEADRRRQQGGRLSHNLSSVYPGVGHARLSRRLQDNHATPMPGKRLPKQGRAMASMTIISGSLGAGKTFPGAPGASVGESGGI